MTNQIDLFDQQPGSLGDQSSRDVIVRVLDRNVVVKAGAGAGKTHELLSRMVECVRRGACDVDEMVAITFTRKAAGELKQRFASTLFEASENASGEEAERLSAALHHVDDCFIGTIHAYCGRLLRERPVEAGLPPDFTELDERDDFAVRDAVWERFIGSLYEEDDPLLAGLADVGIKPHDLVSFFKIRYEFADLALKPTDVPEPDLTEAVERAGKLIQDTLPFLPASWADEDDFTRMARRAILTISNDRLDSTLRQAEFLQHFDAGTRDERKVVMKKWKDNKAARRFRNEEIPELRPHVQDALRRWREFVYMRVAPVADAAIDYYEQYRRRHGLVTFYDLLERTVALLREHPAVRKHFQRRYRRLFVDEFQDTDPMQAEMLMLLASTDPAQTDWTKVVPRPGSLFIVGDEKQSIYRFRRADIETFRAVSDRIEDTGGLVVELTTSFRTVGNLCDTLNGVFRSIFDLEGREFQAPFAKLDPARPDGGDPVGIRRLDTTGIDRGTRAVEAEAERIADFVAAALQGGTEFNEAYADSAVAATGLQGGRSGTLQRRAVPSDFLIVARERANLGAFARALEARGIPYDISGGDPLGKSEELGLLIDLLSVVERPGDPVGYVKYLRGPLVGISDEGFYAFRRAGGTFNYRSQADPPDAARVSSDAGAMKALPSTAAEDAGDAGSDHRIVGNHFDMAHPEIIRIREARDRLARAERELTRNPPYAAMLNIVDWFGLAAFGARREGGTLRAGSMLRVLSYVRQWDVEGKHWVDILRELRGLARDQVTTIETMTMEVGQPDVVRIMTVHQAKGLEAPVVVLADADRGGGWSRAEPHVSRVKGVPTLSMAVDNGRNQIIAQPEGWEADSARESAFREAEETRIRYVGATRARDLLVVCEHKQRGFWNEISMRIPQAPLLVEYPEAPRPARVGSTADLKAIQSKRLAALATSSQPTFQQATVTGGDPAARFVPITTGGRGREYGTAVHQILEALVRSGQNRPDRAYVEAVLRSCMEAEVRESVVLEGVDAILSGTQALVQSDVWKAMTDSREAFAEVPFVLSDEGNLVAGTIDLVYRTDDGWAIVDYKTDAAETESDVAALAEGYAEQIRSYATSWNRITGETVGRAGLWLFSRGTYVPISLSAGVTIEAPPP